MYGLLSASSVRFLISVDGMEKVMKYSEGRLKGKVCDFLVTFGSSAVIVSYSW